MTRLVRVTFPEGVSIHTKGYYGDYRIANTLPGRECSG